MENIAKLMELITQDDKQLAKRLGVSSKEIYRWRTGKAKPTRQRRYKIYVYIQEVINELTKAKNVYK